MTCKQEIINAADSPSIWPLHCLPSFEKTECQALPTCEWSLLIWWQECHRLWLGTSMLAWVFNSCIRLIPQRLADCNLHSIPGKVHVLMLLRRIRDHLLRHQKREQSNSLLPNPCSLHRLNCIRNQRRRSLYSEIFCQIIGLVASPYSSSESLVNGSLFYLNFTYCSLPYFPGLFSLTGLSPFTLFCFLVNCRVLKMYITASRHYSILLIHHHLIITIQPLPPS